MSLDFPPYSPASISRMRPGDEVPDNMEKNVADSERVASLISGGLLIARGLAKRSPLGAGMALLGGALVWRGATGHCSCYQALGVSTRAQVEGSATVEASRSELIRASVSINRPVREVFSFWRELSNLAPLLQELRQSEPVGGDRSHWTVKPTALPKVKWDAEIFREEDQRLIAWKSLPGSTVNHAGTVRFQPAPGNRGTDLFVEMDCEIPGGAAGAALLRLLGDHPTSLIERFLRNLKRKLEVGELPTTEGQSSARKRDRSISRKKAVAA